jgi:tetratricopeptide (TPR) repeat protein
MTARTLCNWGLLVASCAGTPALSAAEPQWVEIRSPHFSVVTDAGEKRGREAAMRFEQMRAVFAVLISNSNVDIPTPLQIVAFRNTRELRQFAPLWHSQPTDVAGLFEYGEDRSFILLDMSVENPWYVVFHEYAHQLLNAMLREETEPWFQEGFAEFFATTQVDDKRALVGQIPPATFEVLDQTGLTKIADLLAVGKNSGTYNESGDRRSAFYAASGMLVHYIYDNDLASKLDVYFDLRLNERLRVEDAIQRAFGISTAAFDKSLREYVKAGRFKGYTVATPPNIVASAYRSAPVSAPEAAAILADVHLHAPDFREKAIEEFQAVLKRDPNNATAWRGLGYAYLLRRQLPDAAEHFRRAEELNPKDPRVHYYSALLMQGEGVLADRSRLPEMIKELETAVSLDPNLAEAYGLLGYAQGLNGDAEHGLATMRKAIGLNPHNESLLYNAAVMYMNHRDFDQAIGLLGVLARSQNEQMAERAGQVLVSARRIRDSLVANAPFEQRRTNLQPLDPEDDEDDSHPQPLGPSVNRQPAEGVGKTQFIKGELTGVDCSAPPSAVLTVTSGGATWKFTTADRQHVVVLGADAFSCSWTKQVVRLNYVQTGPAEGRIVSVEIE